MQPWLNYGGSDSHGIKYACTAAATEKKLTVV